MTIQSNSPKTFKAGEALSEFLRVKIKGSDRTAWLADASDYGVGVNQETVAINLWAAIRLWEHGGSHKCVASGAISAGVKVFAAAGGKVSASGTLIIGTALDAATGDGSVIEVIPHIGYTQSSSSSSSSSST